MVCMLACNRMQLVWLTYCWQTNLKPSLTIPPAEAVVNVALRRIGHVDHCVGVFAHEVSQNTDDTDHRDKFDMPL